MLAPAERANESRDILRRITRSKRTERSEAVHIRKDGVPIHVHMTVSPVVDRAGNAVGAVAIARDITGRKRMEEALRASEARFHAALKSAPISVWNQDRELRYTWLHDPSSEFLPEQVLGKRDWDLFERREDVERLEALKRQVLVSGVGVRQEVSVHIAGVERFFDLTVEPLRTANGDIVGITGTAFDITEHRKLQERLREQAAQLIEADRRKDEFLAVLAHELRNPLAPIYSTLQLFKLQPVQRDPRLEQGLEIMDRPVEQMRRLVDDLLDVSRVAQGRIVLHKEPVDLAEVIKRAVEATRPLIKARRHKLKVSIPPEPILLEADPVRLAQVIGNLLDNAAKYTKEGGRIELTTQCEGDEAVIRVRDTGVGIPSEILPHMFELFSQAEHSLEYARSGLGIGLNLVCNLVQMHDGSVQAESAGPGRGSTFTVRLPLAKRGPAQNDSDTDVQAASAPWRILVVEDNPDVAKSFAMLLDTLGHEVQLVSDGTSALEAVPRFSPDIVFVDIGLPDMDGYEVARRLRAAHGKALHLIALTGYGQEEDRRCAREAGFDQHLTKPVDMEALEQLFASVGAKLN